MTTTPNELTTATDELARVVARLLPSDADAQLAHDFRTALGNLLAATLGGATVMAAGTVVALNEKVDRLAHARAERLRELQLDVDQLATRIHALEDELLDTGMVGQLAAAMDALAGAVAQLNAKAAGDG